MWKYYRSLFCWAFSGAWAIAGAVETGGLLIGGSLGRIFPRWESPMKNLFWMVPLFALFITFLYRAIKAPYHFHLEQQKIIDIINGSGFDIKIGAAIFTSAIMNINASRVELTVTILNNGYPRTAHGWGLAIRTSKRDIKADHHIVGIPSAKGSPRLPALDSRMNVPLGTNEEFAGLINFSFQKIPVSELEKEVFDDPVSIFVLSFLDNFNKKWTVEQNILKMKEEGYFRIR